MDFKERDQYLKKEFKDMYDAVNEKNDVKFILIQTKSSGLVKCNNLNSVHFKIKEKLEDGTIENKFWQYEWTNNDMKLINDICKQAVAANMIEDVKVFKVLGHEFYYGEIDVKSPKTEVEFRDSYCILKNAYEAHGDDKFQYIMIKYEDIEFVYTYGYSLGQK